MIKVPGFDCLFSFGRHEDWLDLSGFVLVVMKIGRSSLTTLGMLRMESIVLLYCLR